MLMLFFETERSEDLVGTFEEITEWKSRPGHSNSVMVADVV